MHEPDPAAQDSQQSSGPTTSVAQDLAQLTRDLRRFTRRARNRGLKRYPIPEGLRIEAAAAPTTPPGNRPEQGPSSAGPSGQTRFASAGSERAASATGAPRGRTPSDAETGPGGVTPEQIRARAAACRNLEELRAEVAKCTACELCKTRTQTVFQDGQGTRGVLFVGEAPGADEDREGLPFVGKAGKLLTDIIEKGMGIRRSEVTIANVLKCRPPDNRDPKPIEKALCTPFLDRQIELLDPQVVIPLGRHAACHLLQSDSTMGQLRGRIHERGGRKFVPTYHPAFLLRSPHMKSKCWADIQLAMAELGLKPGGK